MSVRRITRVNTVCGGGRVGKGHTYACLRMVCDNCSGYRATGLRTTPL